jgi:DNA-binding IclR family transcriptional regulator
MPTPAESPRDAASVQSLARGLAVLRLLAEHGELSATEIARRLGLHQSSASRMLRALEEAGFVCKPAFRRFALDYGVLHFAGVAMERFPEVAAAVRVCAGLHARTGFGAAAGLLRGNRLVYLAQMHAGAQGAVTLISASDFPLHLSSLGLVLLQRQLGAGMIPVLAESIARHGAETAPRAPRPLYDLVRRAVARDGLLYLEHYGPNRFNAAGIFETWRGPAALAVYGSEKEVRRERVVACLRGALAELRDLRIGPSPDEHREKKEGERA